MCFIVTETWVSIVKKKKVSKSKNVSLSSFVAFLFVPPVLMRLSAAQHEKIPNPSKKNAPCKCCLPITKKGIHFPAKYETQSPARGTIKKR